MKSTSKKLDEKREARIAQERQRKNDFNFYSFNTNICMSMETHIYI